MDSHLCFQLRRSEVKGRILIPKYYDPEVAQSVKTAGQDFDLVSLNDALLPGNEGSQLGVWIPREAYGGGTIPYVRTSDFHHWRIRPDFKKGISFQDYTRFSKRIDIRENDILMVAHGSYRVGDVVLVTQADLPLLLQDHVYRLRLRPEFDPRLFLASLSTSFVRMQVRTKQFSAEILDKLGERHLELVVPVPRNSLQREAVIASVQRVLDEHVVSRAIISKTAGSYRAIEPRPGFRSFRIQRAQLRKHILIPRYYDPLITADLQSTSQSVGGWIALGDLVKDGLLQITTGVEVGKMAYGTGDISFVRTSDVIDWEISANPTHGVSEDVFDKHSRRGSLQSGDVVLVRDGTYLVGAPALVVEEDLPALFCGGIYRLRSLDDRRLPPAVLLALLNLPLVRRQIRAKQFTRDVIDTLGKRVSEVLVPNPASLYSKEIGVDAQMVIDAKRRIKKELVIASELVSPDLPQRVANRPGWSMR